MEGPEISNPEIRNLKLDWINLHEVQLAISDFRI